MSRKKKDNNRVLVYQYPFYAIKTEAGFTWDPVPEELDKLFLEMPWKPVVESFIVRKDFYWGFELRGESDVFPILEGKVELEINSISNPCLSVEMAIIPSKLEVHQRTILNELFIKYLDDEDFLVFWDDSPQEPGDKKQKNLKKKICKLLETIPVYNKENNIDPEQSEITPLEALKFFGYAKGDLPSEENFKKRLREYQLKYHPDANNGDEKQFKHLQKCRKLLEEVLDDIL